MCAIAGKYAAIGTYSRIELCLELVATSAAILIFVARVGVCDNTRRSSTVCMVDTFQVMCHPAHIQSLSLIVERIVQETTDGTLATTLGARKPEPDNLAAEDGRSLHADLERSSAAPRSSCNDGLRETTSDQVDVISAEGSMIGIPYSEAVELWLRTVQHEVLSEVLNEPQSSLAQVVRTAKSIRADGNRPSSDLHPSVFMRSTLAERVFLLTIVLAWNDVGFGTTTAVQHLLWSLIYLLLLIACLVCFVVFSVRPIPVQGDGTAGFFLLFATVPFAIDVGRLMLLARFTSSVAASLKIWSSLRVFWSQRSSRRRVSCSNEPVPARHSPSRNQSLECGRSYAALRARS